MLLGIVASSLLTMAWLASSSTRPAPAVAIYWLFQVVLDVAFLAFSRRVATAVAGQPRPVRRFWRTMTFSGALFLTADLLQTTTGVLRHPGVGSASPGVVPVALVASGAACILWVMLTHPSGMTGRARLRLWLDAATVVTAGSVFAWYFSVGGGADRPTVDVAGALLASSMQLLALFGVAKLILGGTPPFTFRAGVCGAIGAALLSLSAGLGDLGVNTHLGPLLAARLVPNVFLALSPRLQELQVRANPGALVRPARPYSRLPYVAAAATQVLLVVMVVRMHPDARLWGALVGMVAITGLVVGRQLGAFAENAGLLRQLDASLTDLRRHEQRFRSLVQHASDITLLLHRDGTIAYASPALERIMGIAPDGVHARRALDILAPDDRATLAPVLATLLRSPAGVVTFETRAQHADGSWRLLEVTCTNLLDDPSVNGIICNASDVTEARELQDRLQHQALHDPLTQLANRALFDERLQAALRPGLDGAAAVLMIDLDGFKQVNDTLGHHTGDALLVAVAGRLRGCVRPGDTVSRLGGDEFGVLLPGVSTGAGAQLAERIQAAFTDPVSVDGHELTIRASVGLAVSEPGETVDALLRGADAAMYETKRLRRARSGAQPVGR
ncbi:MAG: hypothetical protein V7637_4542 [Mycobacteriales bacterium]|jgi:diguanylate cyclase (GGDEF)-like protein/PAS domain S-box-containing protein